MLKGTMVIVLVWNDIIVSYTVTLHEQDKLKLPALEKLIQ